MRPRHARARAGAAAPAFARGCAGATAVEFALVLPALVLLLLAVLEFALNLFVESSLESGILAASRFGITGSGEAGTSREDQIRAIVQARTYGLVDMTRSVISTKVYPTFGDIGQQEPFADANHNGVHDAGEGFTDVNGNGRWDPDMGAAGLGGAGAVVLYEVTYEMGAITDLLQPIMGRIAHHAAVAVRNEPY